MLVQTQLEVHSQHGEIVASAEQLASTAFSGATLSRDACAVSART
ncbi:MAG TPA: hypothetical protein VMV69_19460 [Pirellulales bacterium]|nr:hypothetical protein [Pirellulales bacterium]